MFAAQFFNKSASFHCYEQVSLHDFLIKADKNILKCLVFPHLFSTFALAFKHCSGFGAVGSAHVWGARGRWFESSNPDRKERKGLMINPFRFVVDIRVGEKSAMIFAGIGRLRCIVG